MLFERTRIELECFSVVDQAGREHFVEETAHFKEAFPPKPWILRFLRLLVPHDGSGWWLEMSRSFELVDGAGPLKLNADGSFSHASTGALYSRKPSRERVGAFAEYELAQDAFEQDVKIA